MYGGPMTEFSATLMQKEWDVILKALHSWRDNHVLSEKRAETFHVLHELVKQLDDRSLD